MPTVTIRVIDSDLKEWTTAANLRGMSISEWIRRACLARVGMDAAKHSTLESEQGNGSSNDKNLSRSNGTTVPRRRVAAGGRGRSRSASDGHRATDIPPVDTGIVGESLASDTPSQSNTIPVIHTAASNRLTCLCNTCTSYRKTNDIPLGGVPKKESRFKK